MKYTLLRRQSHNVLFKLLMVVALLLAVSMSQLLGGTAQAKDDKTSLVTIHVDGMTHAVPTRIDTVDELLKQAGIVLSAGDLVEPAKDTLILQDSFSVNIYRSRPVIITDSLSTRKIINTGYQSPRKIAEAAGVQVYPEDDLQMRQIVDIVSAGAIGEEIIVTRATAVQLSLYGTVSTVRTRATTVGELLKEKGVVVADGETLEPAAETKLANGMTVRVSRNGKQTISVEEEIAYTTKQIEDANLAANQKRIEKPGVKGKKQVTYEVNLVDGKEVSRVKIQEIVTTKPQQQVEVVGTNGKNFMGSLEDSFAALRGCEAGGNYANKKNPRYRGAYQFDYGTWANYGGYYDPADAPPGVQDQKAYETYLRRGWSPWPACSKKLGLR